MSVSIKFLGTSDGYASDGRGHAAILVRVSGRTYLFDAGESVSRTMNLSGIQFDEVDHLFLSHLHADHVGGLPMLLQAMWLAGRKKALPIHLPHEGVEVVEMMRRGMYLFDEILPYQVELRPYNGEAMVEDGGNRITPFPTTHLAQIHKQAGAKHGRPCEAFCFRVESSHGRSVVYSGDIGQPSDLAPALYPKVDVLICELAHFPPHGLFDFLKKQHVGKIVLTHVGSSSRNDATRQQAAEMLGERVIWAEDGMEVEEE